MSKRYTSFKEIDNDLRVLKLKKEIDLICLKNDYHRFRNFFTINALTKELMNVLGNSLLSSRGNLFKEGIGLLLRRFLLK